MSHQLSTVVPLGDLARSAEAGLISALIANAGGHLGWRKLRDAPPDGHERDLQDPAQRPILPRDRSGKCQPHLRIERRRL